jgi:hypothetical protein
MSGCRSSAGLFCANLRNGCGNAGRKAEFVGALTLFNESVFLRLVWRFSSDLFGELIFRMGLFWQKLAGAQNGAGKAQKKALLLHLNRAFCRPLKGLKTGIEMAVGGCPRQL